MGPRTMETKIMSVIAGMTTAYHDELEDVYRSHLVPRAEIIDWLVKLPEEEYRDIREEVVMLRTARKQLDATDQD